MDQRQTLLCAIWRTDANSMDAVVFSSDGADIQIYNTIGAKYHIFICIFTFVYADQRSD